MSFLVTYSASWSRVWSPLATMGKTTGDGSGIAGQPRQMTPRALISSVHAGASAGPPHTANAPISSTAFTASARAAVPLSDVPDASRNLTTTLRPYVWYRLFIMSV